MAQGKFISYLRVSTERQGASGLGLDAQRKTVTDYLDGGKWELLREYVEVESGGDNDRPCLKAALAHAKITGARLIIARLDRLSRNLAFIAALQESGAKFVAADMPEANETMIQFMAVIAQYERQRISQNTKAALAAARQRGVKLGNPNGARALVGRSGSAKGVARLKAKADEHAANVLPEIDAIRAAGITGLKAIADELNRREILSANGGRWHATTVANLLRRIKP
jgi:DNA invertase Pin-like site-specific DNA recombinase